MKLYGLVSFEYWIDLFLVSIAWCFNDAVLNSLNIKLLFIILFIVCYSLFIFSLTQIKWRPNIYFMYFVNVSKYIVYEHVYVHRINVLAYIGLHNYVHLYTYVHVYIIIYMYSYVNV